MDKEVSNFDKFVKEIATWSHQNKNDKYFKYNLNKMHNFCEKITSLFSVLNLNQFYGIIQCTQFVQNIFLSSIRFYKRWKTVYHEKIYTFIQP